MVQKLNPFSGRQFQDANGNPYVGAQLFIYQAGTTTKQTTTQDKAGSTNHANPIVLNSRGEPADSGGSAQAIWQPDGQNVKLVLAPSTDSDPPTTPYATWDNIEGINDTAAAGTTDQWVEGSTPTYIGATSFSVTGDQTSTFHVGRRIKTTNSGGTIYSTIIAVAYTTLTTVTIISDSGSLDSGLSAVYYSLLTADNDAIPVIITGNAGQMKVYNAAENELVDWAPGGYIYGLITSNGTDTDHDIDITAGECADSGGNYILKLTAAITKQIDATWAAGDAAGGCFTGAVAVDTWYHVFIIRKDSDGTIDAGFDTSITAANIPTGYTAYRRIGSVLTDASANIYGYKQSGNHFEWNTTKQDLQITQPSTTATALTVSVAPDVECMGYFMLFHRDETPASIVFSYVQPVSSTSSGEREVSETVKRHSGSFLCLTDTNGQIEYWADTDLADLEMIIRTFGYDDFRGQYQ